VILRLDTGWFDPARAVIVGPAGEVALRPAEARLLAWLAQHPGETVSHDRLLREVWGYSARAQSKTVYTTVSRLRSKIEADPANPRHLLPVAKVGYRFVPAGPSASARQAPSIIGRDPDLEGIERLLDGGARLLTLVGPGGVGKTHLARCVEARVAQRLGDRTLFV
jgi:DNA-binding winged helix-turn-helix (wHTH) protein